MFSYEEDKNANPTLFWVNPWNGQKESLAHFYWPTHDVKKTRLVEEFFDLMGQKCAEAAYAAWNAINNMEEASHAIAAHCGCPKHAPTDPKLAELLEATKDHVITPEEKEAQRQSWVRGEMGIGDDRAEAEDRKRMAVLAAQSACACPSCGSQARNKRRIGKWSWGVSCLNKWHDAPAEAGKEGE